MTVEKPAAENPVPDRSNPFMLLCVVVLAVLALDLATKAWVLRTLPLYTQKEIIPGFFNLVHVRNTGVAFSFFCGNRQPVARPHPGRFDTSGAWGDFFFSIGNAGGKKRPSVFALGLIAGGALGNLADRLRFGNVVDFLDFYIGPYHWPAFNVADVAVTVGAALLLVAVLRGEKDHPHRS